MVCVNGPGPGLGADVVWFLSIAKMMRSIHLAMMTMPPMAVQALVAKRLSIGFPGWYVDHRTDGIEDQTPTIALVVVSALMHWHRDKPGKAAIVPEISQTVNYGHSRRA